MSATASYSQSGLRSSSIPWEHVRKAESLAPLPTYSVSESTWRSSPADGQAQLSLRSTTPEGAKRLELVVMLTDQLLDLPTFSSRRLFSGADLHPPHGCN